jgi:hypothetical protein
MGFSLQCTYWKTAACQKLPTYKSMVATPAVTVVNLMYIHRQCRIMIAVENKNDRYPSITCNSNVCLGLIGGMPDDLEI